MPEYNPFTDQKPAFQRRQILLFLAAMPAASLPSVLLAQDRQIWSVQEAHQALLSDEIRLIDIRSREEWLETGVAKGAWPISLHETGFEARLFKAHSLANERTVGLICATGGRSGALLKALRRAKYTGYIDVSEGMLGSRKGPGWISAGLPVVSADVALSSLPTELA